MFLVAGVSSIKLTPESSQLLLIIAIHSILGPPNLVLIKKLVPVGIALGSLRFEATKFFTRPLDYPVVVPKQQNF